jgi:site-specific DNA-methyltransferase (adenine-specific)
VTARIICGDCLDVMREMEPASVDAIVTDPPYGLNFMARDWDHGVPGERYWIEALRVAKPGAHLLAFGGTRTFHRLTCAIEDAGWEIRDCLGWIYGSGFPKSLDVSKAIDKAAGAEREIVGPYRYDNRRTEGSGPETGDNCYGQYARAPAGETAPATDAAKKWQGFGTALKPAWEPIILARAPLAGTVAATVCEHGTGALNIDACRIEAGDLPALQKNWDRVQSEKQGIASTGLKAIDLGDRAPTGRWPANLIHDGSDDVMALFPVTTATRTKEPDGRENRGGSMFLDGRHGPDNSYSDAGSAARFFYCAKASRSERGEGNVHPTVKPLALMRYLCRLIAPPGGLVLDPFAGSGSTLIAAVAEGFEAVGIEKDAAYAEIARQRLGPLDQFVEVPA